MTFLGFTAGTGMSYYTVVTYSTSHFIMTALKFPAFYLNAVPSSAVLTPVFLGVSCNIDF